MLVQVYLRELEHRRMRKRQWSDKSKSKALFNKVEKLRHQNMYTSTKLTGYVK